MARNTKQGRGRSRGYQPGRIIEQSGGMNNAVHPTILNENEAVLLKNVDLEEKGTVKMCKGRKERFPAPFDANNPCNGITAFYPNTTTSRLVIGAGTKLYTDNPHLMYDWDTQEDFNAGHLCNAKVTENGVELRDITTPVTFTRDSIKYKSDGTQVSKNIPSYEVGKFGNGVHIEEGTTNIVPLDKQKFEGWNTYRDSSVTLTQNQTVSEWNATDATRIQTSGGTHVIKYYIDIWTPADGEAYQATISLWVKVPSDKPAVMIHSNLGGGYDTVSPGESRRVVITVSGTGNGVGRLQIQFRALNDSDNLDFYAWRPQMEKKLYATSWTPDTRQPDSLYYTQNIPDEWFISGVWVPDQDSTVDRTNNLELFTFYYDSYNRVYVMYNPSVDKFRFYKGYSSSAIDLYGNTVTFSTGDIIEWAAAQLTQDYGDLTAGMHLWYRINGGSVVHVSNTDTNLPTPPTKAYIGCLSASGYECNGVIDAVKLIDIKAAAASGNTVNNAWAESYLTSATAPTADPSALLLCNFDNTLDAANVTGYVWISDSKDISNATDENSGKLEGTATVPGNAIVSYRTSTSADNLTWDVWAPVDSSNNINSTYRDNIKFSVTGIIDGDNKPVFQSAILSYDDTPQATELASGFIPGGQFYFASLLSKLAIFNKLDAPKKWDGINTVEALGGSPPHAQYTATHKNYLFAAGSGDNPSRLYWSDLLDIDTWNALSFIDISPNDGDWITGLLTYGDYLIITKQRSIWALLGSNPSDFAVIRLNDNIGCIAPRSLVKMPRGFAFVSADGIHISDLSNPVKLTERVKVTWDGLNKRRLNLAAATFYDNKLRVDIPNGSSVTNNIRIIFDTIRQCLYLEEFNKHASCYTKFVEAGEEILLYGHSTEGQVSRADYGTTDAREPITMTWIPKHFNFGSSLIEKKVRKTYLAVVPALSDTDIKVTYIVNGVESGSITVTVNGSATGGETKIQLNPRDIDVRDIDVSMGYKIEQTASNGGVKFHELIQEYRMGRIKV